MLTYSAWILWCRFGNGIELTISNRYEQYPLMVMRFFRNRRKTKEQVQMELLGYIMTQRYE